MSEDNGDQNDFSTRPSPKRRAPDAYGQAALLLVESLMHLFVERGTLSLGDALDALITAREVKVDLAYEIGEPGGRLEESLSLLIAIEKSFSGLA